MDQTFKGGSPAVYETSPPSDPQTLLAELWQRDLASLGIKSAANVKAYAVGHKNDDMWMALGDLLNSPIARLRATAYAALSYVPGSKIDGNATDSLGRSGIAVTWMPPFPGNGFTYIISPTTGNLLEKDLIQGHTYGGDQAGSAVIRWVYHPEQCGRFRHRPSGRRQPAGQHEHADPMSGLFKRSGRPIEWGRRAVHTTLRGHKPGPTRIPTAPLRDRRRRRRLPGGELPDRLGDPRTHPHGGRGPSLALRCRQKHRPANTQR